MTDQQTDIAILEAGMAKNSCSVTLLYSSGSQPFCHVTPEIEPILVTPHHCVQFNQWVII